MDTLHKRQKHIFWLVICLGSVSIILLVLVVFNSYRFRQTSSEIEDRLIEQNAQLANQNMSLIKTVEQLNITVNDGHRQDSALMRLSNLTLGILPDINNKITTIKSQYEKNSAFYRNLGVDDAERYISNEARRLRAEQAQ